MSKQSRKKFPPGKVAIAILLIGGLIYTLGFRNPEHGQSASAKSPTKADPVALHYTDHPKVIELKPPLVTVASTKGATKGDKEITPLGITLHWWEFSSGGNIEGLRTALRNNPGCGVKEGCSVQFGVTMLGGSYRMMQSPVAFARHASGANDTTIGIEIEGGPKDFAPPNKKGFNKVKFEAVVNLVLLLMKEYPTIKLDGPVKCDHVVGIHGHDEYNKCRKPGNGTKTDPGPAYTKAVKTAVKSMQR